MSDYLSSEMRRNPGFESAVIILPSVDYCGACLGKQVRVVGSYSYSNLIISSVEELKGNVLVLKQGECHIRVKINEYYQNEHQIYRFIEVIGIVESVESSVDFDPVFKI